VRKLSMALVALLVLGNIPLAFSADCCPFCSAVSQTIRQEMEAMDVVAIGTIVKGSESESDAEFEINTIIRGDSLVREKQKSRINYFGKAADGTQFLLRGVDPPDLLWSSPLPVSQKAVDYVKAITKLPEDPMKRIEFYLGYLEDEDSLLARDAYDEFASAPYADLKMLAPKLDRERLLGWIKDTNLPPDRKRLYLVLLGICGKPEDAKLLEELLQSDDPNKRAGLDAMIACYVTLLGDEGLKLIDELFLSNKQSQYADTYAAIMALRFHGTDGGIISKERVLKSMQLILQRPELADLVIPDLARWEDWSQIDRLVELFKTADEESSWVRVPVFNYLRACPKPEAAAKIEELKELDPAAFKRATSFFPVPQPTNPPPTPTSTSISDPLPVRGLAQSDVPFWGKTGVELAVGQPVLVTPMVARIEPNRFEVVGVVTMFAMSLWLAMWLAMSGGGRYGILTYAVATTESHPK
jgi:hypothetical protein